MGTYEPCVLGSDGNCTRWSHDHAADRPPVTPRVGDVITTAEQLDALPSLTIVVDANEEVQQRHGHLATQDGDYSAWLGVMPPTCKPSPEVALPATVLYVPGEQPCRHCGSCDGPPSCPDCDHADRPSVTDNARAVREAAISLYRAMRRANPDAWAEVDEVEDWAYWDDIVRTAQVTLAAGRVETTTATDEDAARVINEVLGGGMDNHARIAAHRLADADLLATARTRPTREQIDRAVGEVLFNAMNHPDPAAVLGRSIVPLRTKVTDAVLELLRDGAR